MVGFWVRETSVRGDSFLEILSVNDQCNKVLVPKAKKEPILEGDRPPFVDAKISIGGELRSQASGAV
jgi:hypothetical protein